MFSLVPRYRLQDAKTELSFRILQVIKNRSRGRPGNEASNVRVHSTIEPAHVHIHSSHKPCSISCLENKTPFFVANSDSSGASKLASLYWYQTGKGY